MRAPVRGPKEGKGPLIRATCFLCVSGHGSACCPFVSSALMMLALVVGDAVGSRASCGVGVRHHKRCAATANAHATRRTNRWCSAVQSADDMAVTCKRRCLLQGSGSCVRAGVSVSHGTCRETRIMQRESTSLRDHQHFQRLGTAPLCGLL